MALAAPRRRVGVAAVWYLPLQFSSGDAGLYAPLSLGVALSELLGFWAAPGRIASPATPGSRWRGVWRGISRGGPAHRLTVSRGLPLSHSHSLNARRSVLRSKSARVRRGLNSYIIALAVEIAAEFEPVAHTRPVSRSLILEWARQAPVKRRRGAAGVVSLHNSRCELFALSPVADPRQHLTRRRLASLPPSPWPSSNPSSSSRSSA